MKLHSNRDSLSRVPGSRQLLRLRDTRMLPLHRQSISSLAVSALLCLTTSLLFASADPNVRHWFVFPVTACGILIATDALDWFRGKLTIFDPIGIIGVLGVHFFYLSPLLHVHLDYWMKYVAPPPDWRDWLGAMAGLNCLGILAYRLGRTVCMGSRTLRPRAWQIKYNRFVQAATMMIVATAVLQLLIYSRFGGLSGYVAAVTEKSGAFTGMGWVFMISESLPILAFMVFAVKARRGEPMTSWPVIIVALLCFFGLTFLFGGLRGSRSTTIWKLFWAVGICHFWLRPISRKVTLCGLGFLLLFMYLYGFYKTAGAESLRVFHGAGELRELEDRTGRTLDRVLLGDLGRADVQAYLLYQLVSDETGYRLAWGRTYIAAAAMLIPAQIWSDRPVSKTYEGTVALYGEDLYARGLRASNIYGLGGETLLNFGPLAIPVTFFLWGAIVSYCRTFFATIELYDCRVLLAPFVVNACFLMLVGDSSNIVYFIVSKGLIPFLLVRIGAGVYRVRPCLVPTNTIYWTRGFQLPARLRRQAH